MNSSQSALAKNTIIADRYRVVEQLGEGGMGVVYSVEHTLMRKLFALKVLHREMLRLPEVVARFEREAVLAGSIDHPNVAAATDFGKLPDGSFFLILELVTGKSLRDVIAEGPLEIVRAHAIMRGITAGVAAAHAKGIVHRDLKPENVMLVERDGVSDFVKVLDFGIAKGAAAEAPPGTAGADQPLTQLGTLMGTPQYMSPEQALGQVVDARSDLYALGVIFHEMVMGEPPFQGEPLQVLRGHVATPPPVIPPERVAGVTVPVDAIVTRLLVKEPAERFQSASELASALEGVVTTRADAVEERLVAAALEPRASVTARTRRTLVMGAVAAALVGATLVGVLALTQRDTAPVAAAALVAKESSDPSATTPSATAEPPQPMASATTEEPPPVASAEEPAPVTAPVTSVAAREPGTKGGKSAPPKTVTRRTGPFGIYVPSPKDWLK